MNSRSAKKKGSKRSDKRQALTAIGATRKRKKNNRSNKP